MKPYECLLSLLLVLLVSGVVVGEEIVPKSDGEVELEPPEEDQVVVLRDVNHILSLLDDNEKRLMLAVLYAPACPHSEPLVALLEQTAADLQGYFDSFMVSVERPILAKLDTRNDESFIASLGVDSFPTLYFFRVVNHELVVMDYMGRSEEAQQLTSIVLHYWYRYVYGPVFELDTMEDVQAFLDHNGPGMLSPVKGGLHPDYTNDEKETIAWLMNTPDDPHSILIQCQKSSSELPQPQPAYQEFEDFCQLQLARRDVACFSILNCGTGLDGEIVSILVGPDNYTGLASIKRPASQPIHEFGIQQATPTLLFFERISTAPIAFPLWRSVHAVLFVKLSRDEASRDAISQFYDACLHRRLATAAEDMVCLVVPETETRVLTTFGVDIWTPLDERVTKGTKVPDLLPAMMITDQRATNQLKRYYLDAPHLIHGGDAIEAYFHAFWNHELEPECKSSNKPLRKNKYGVEMISGKTFQAAVLDRVHRHSLLYVFSPTCGHCKRFSILWNKLAALVVSVGWSDFLDIQQLDSTKNEIVQVEIDPAFVPAVYYFGPDQKKNTPMYYDVVDKFQHGAGRLDDPLEIVDWFLDVAGLDEGLLLDALDK